MSRLRLNNKHSLMGRLGSFWGQGLKAASLKIVRKLTHFVDHTSAISSLNGAVNHLAGAGMVSIEHRTLHFKPSDVVTLDEIFQKRVRERYGDDAENAFHIMRVASDTMVLENWRALVDEAGTAVLISETDALLLFPDTTGNSRTILDGLSPLYLLRVPMTLSVYSIEVEGRLLLAGIDFTQHPGLLVFHERPDTLFPTLVLLIRSGEEGLPCNFNYTLRMDGVSGSHKAASTYYKGYSSCANFERAIAKAAGLIVTEGDCAILSSVVNPVGVTYYTTLGVLRVPYDHTPVSNGVFVASGTVIGGAVRVLGAQNTNGAWWRETNWSAGLSLDGLCPIKGLTVPDANVLCDTVALGADYHARLHLHGSEEALAKYWEYIKANELITGKYINSQIGLDGLEERLYIHGIDFFFTWLLGAKSIVVELQTKALGEYYHQRALDFIAREKPVNVVTIINEV